jgi:hypothetical protein
MLQDFQLGRFKRGFEAIGETDQVFFSGHRRRTRDHTHCATRMHERVARSADFHECDNLRSSENVVRLVRHCWFEDTEAQPEGESG